jgi:hypothetical protein
MKKIKNNQFVNSNRNRRFSFTVDEIITPLPLIDAIE